MDFADEYDVHFIFDDNVPAINFYTVPFIEIFAIDSNGGYLGSLGEGIDLDGTAPICYIDKNHNCFLIANNGKEFLNNTAAWKTQMTPYKNVEFFFSKEEAMSKYEFLDSKELKSLLA